MRRSLIPLALLVVGVLLLLGWATLAELEAADPTAEPASATSEATVGEEVQPEEPGESDPRFPLPAPTRTGVERPDDSGCVACHTSQEDLQELAEEPEQEESLSEGEG